MFDQTDTVALGEFQTKLGVSRKYAQMYLDYFDRCKVSKLVGDRRVLLNGDPGALFSAWTYAATEADRTPAGSTGPHPYK